MVQSLWRIAWRLLKRLTVELPYDPAVPRQGVYPEKALLIVELPYDPAVPCQGIYPEKALICEDSCSPIFIAALVTIAKKWKKSKCPSIEQ